MLGVCVVGGLRLSVDFSRLMRSRAFLFQLDSGFLSPRNILFVCFSSLGFLLGQLSMQIPNFTVAVRIFMPVYYGISMKAVEILGIYSHTVDQGCGQQSLSWILHQSILYTIHIYDLFANYRIFTKNIALGICNGGPSI